VPQLSRHFTTTWAEVCVVVLLGVPYDPISSRRYRIWGVGCGSGAADHPIHDLTAAFSAFIKTWSFFGIEQTAGARAILRDGFRDVDLRDGFRDAETIDMTELVHRGVWLSDQSLDTDQCAWSDVVIKGRARLRPIRDFRFRVDRRRSEGPRMVCPGGAAESVHQMLVEHLIRFWRRLDCV
jgi:hypothetical protein